MISFPVTIRLGKNAQDYISGKPRPALFLDRDGIVNIDTGYVGKVADVAVLKDTCATVHQANRQGIPVVVVSNQSAVGRGYFGWDSVAAVDETIALACAEHDAHFDIVLYAGGASDVSGEDLFRKPAPGLFLLASRILSLDMSMSFMVGDKPSDLEAAARAGLGGGVLLSANPNDIVALAATFKNFSAASDANLATALGIAMKFLNADRVGLS